MGGVIVSGRTSQIGAVTVSSRLIYQLNLCPQLTMANQGMPPAVVSSHPFQFKFLTASIKEWLAAEVVMSEKSSSRPLSHSERTAFHSCSTCTQVPRFSFRKKKISGLEWGLNPHTHISGVMLYQLSYQALGSKLVRRKGIQVLALGAHYIRKNISLMEHPWQ